jgi:formylglycine-generating enzyme required for sulfatase activity
MRVRAHVKARRPGGLVALALALLGCPSVPPFAGGDAAVADARGRPADAQGDASRDAVATGGRVVPADQGALGGATPDAAAGGALADATGGVVNRPDQGVGGQPDAQGPSADAAAGGAGGQQPDAAPPEPLPPGYVRVGPGEFQMGSPEGEAGREVGEVRHRVTLTRTLAVKTTEVTQAEWNALMASRPATWMGCGLNCPVETVSLADMKAWCNAASTAAGLPPCYDAQGAFLGLDCRGLRLPTEAEWEYFARAGSETAYHTGDCLDGVQSCVQDDNLGRAGWYCRNTANDSTHAVASLEPNAWGLYDVHGNVWEMTQDGFAEYPGGDRTDPLGDPAAAERVVRGGSAGNAPWRCRAATRGHFDAGVRDRYLGFRPVRTL